MLYLQNYRAKVSTNEILHGINLTIKAGEVHAIMGPNGSGKTTLAMSLMGHPNYSLLRDSQFTVNGNSMIDLLPEERAKNGLFVSFQTPTEITGVSLLAFLRTSYKALHPDQKIPLSEFKVSVKDALHKVHLDEKFMQRSVNEGFSGGEKKRAEIVQLLVLKPKFAILDEIDSGLDVDSLRIVANTIRELVNETKMGILIITHYQRILHYLNPDFVHVLVDGEIIKSDGMNLVKTIEEEGYAAI